MSFRILHVDDDPLMRDVVESSLLLDPSLTVTSCADGGEAVEKAAELGPDLVLCDVMMPGLDGPAVLKQLHENADTAKIPVVFMTARAPQSEIDEWMSLGATAIIVKPFDPKKLAKTVRDQLQSLKFTSATGDFTERLQADAAKLAMFRLEMRANPDSQMLPDGLRTCAHQLAGAAGIFNFPIVSAAAAALEDAVIERMSGKDDLRAIRAKLDALIECIKRTSPHPQRETDDAPANEELATGAARPTPPLAIRANRKAPRMLIADDDPAILRLLADRCAKMGFRVDTATNGMQLLIKARQNAPDILIVDVNMPEVDGLSVCTRFLDPGSKPVEVVIITGSNDEQTVDRCKSLGLFYGRKGPDFWKDLETALAEIYPDMAQKIGELDELVPHAVVPEQPRVLVVDDDPDIERFLTSRLGKCGVRTLFAADALHAFRIARREKPSVILSDYSMPDGDAYYLLHRLRSRPETEHIPVIVMTGRNMDEAAKQSLMREIGGRPGAALVLNKSLDIEELFGALQRYCGFARNRI
jgi:CheY-like chemotaxis protein